MEMLRMSFLLAVLVVLCLSGSVMATDPNLIAHWQLDDGTGSVAEDSAGDNDGTVYGAVWTDGIIDGALDFDGDDDYVEVPDSNEFTTDTGTISAWIKMDSWGGDEAGRIIEHLKWHSTGNADGFQMAVIGQGYNRFNLNIHNGTSYCILRSADDSLSLGGWYHVSAVWDGTNIYAYVDGVQSGDTAAQTTSMGNPAEVLYIGIHEYIYWCEFDGLIDDVRFYDRALDANEISQLYQEGSGGGLVAHWKFDDGTGSVAEDSAGDNDGTVYGAVWTDGIIDGALDFDGTDDYVDTNSADLDLAGTDTITVSAWICPRGQFGDETGVIVNDYDRNNRLGWITDFYSDNTFRAVNMDSGKSRKRRSSPLALNQWHHVAAVIYPTGYPDIYANGQLDNNYYASEDPTTELYRGNGNVLIGKVSKYTTPYALYNGKIDDVRVYDRALDANEISQLYGEVEVGMTYHVDGAEGNDLNDGLTPETAFATIQRGIDEANELDTVLVWPGVYNESGTDGIDFNGKGITVTSAAEPAVLEVPGYYAVSFTHGEGPGSILSNFIIRGSYTGVLCSASSPTIKNVTVVNNENGAIGDTGADPQISNSIFWNNTNGDLYECQASYSYIQDETEANLVAYWQLDGDATDSAGSNDGTIYGATPTTGQINDALDFDGDDDYVEVPDSDEFTTNTGTISAWIKMDSWGGEEVGIIIEHRKWHSSGNADGFEIGVHGNGYNSLFTNLYDGYSHSNLGSATDSLSLGPWYHIAVVWDGSELAAFINGAQSGSPVAQIANIGNPAEVLYIGIHEYIHWREFDGSIDDVRFYDRALSSQEIQAMYGCGLNGLEFGPLFADANSGDYHLMSERGRYWPEHDVWVLDKVTSPCVDGGDPDDDAADEPMPNGGLINMGAYGGTEQGSMSESQLSADLNGDGIVNLLDFAIMADEWMETI